MAKDQPKAAGFTRESAFRIARAVKRVEGRAGSEAPLPKRPRHVGGDGGSGRLRLARATSAITAASDNLIENWGSGTAWLTNKSTGELEGESDVAIDNPLQIEFVEDAMLWLDDSFNPPRVHDGTCLVATWVEPEE